jgi:hypothetical protein
MAAHRPVRTPRHTYPSVSALARALNTYNASLYPYLVEHGDGYELKPLRREELQRWHRTVYRRRERSRRVSA